MCTPIAAAAVLTIAQGAAQYSAVKQSNAYARSEIQRESQLSAQATQNQADQINAQASTDMSARAIQAARERAALRVAAGEAGVSGNSPAISEMRSQFAEGYDITTINGNRLAMLKQGALEGDAAQSRLRSDYNRYAPPSPLASALTIGANVAGLYASKVDGRPIDPSAPKIPR